MRTIIFRPRNNDYLFQDAEDSQSDPVTEIDLTLSSLSAYTKQITNVLSKYKNAVSLKINITALEEEAPDTVNRTIDQILSSKIGMYARLQKLSIESKIKAEDFGTFLQLILALKDSLSKITFVWIEAAQMDQLSKVIDIAIVEIFIPDL